MALQVLAVCGAPARPLSPSTAGLVVKVEQQRHRRRQRKEIQAAQPCRRTDEGRVIEEWVQTDTHDFLRQLGALGS